MNKQISAFGGVFNTLDAKLLEIMLSDPEQVYQSADSDEFKRADVDAALERLVGQGVALRKKPGYILNLKSKRVIALHLLSMSQHDDADDTHYMDAQIRRWCKPTYDPPV